MANNQRAWITKIPRLFELMANRNIKAVQISDKTGISTSNISDWKSGRSAPGIDSLNLLADFFDVSVDYLLGRETAAPQLDADERRLLEAFRSFNQEGREMLLRQAEIMAKSGDFKNKRDSSELGA